MAYSALTDGYLNSTTVGRCFDAAATLRAMLEFEAALALAEGELGLIPATGAELIAAIARDGEFDLEVLRRETVESSNPAIPLVRLLTAAVAARDARAARYVHWGSTSQDVMDSALMLNSRAALHYLDHQLGATIDLLVALVDTHRHTLMVARSLSQHAAPTTFGCKAAGWLNALLTAQERLRELAAALPLQFGGASGTLAAFGGAGVELAEGVARRLELAAVMPWHTERSSTRELAAALASMAAAAGKIANDIVLMAQTEVNELREATAAERGGSSALPHKRNPVAAIAVCAGAARTPALLATVFAAFDQTHERAAGAWHAETAALVDLFVIAGGVAEQLRKSLDAIEVDIDSMRANLARSGGLVMSEAVVMALAPALGRAAAQAEVKAAVALCQGGSDSFAEALLQRPQIAAQVEREVVLRALDPINHLGIAQVLINNVLARAARMSNNA